MLPPNPLLGRDQGQCIFHRLSLVVWLRLVHPKSVLCVVPRGHALSVLIRVNVRNRVLLRCLAYIIGLFFKCVFYILMKKIYIYIYFDFTAAFARQKILGV